MADTKISDMTAAVSVADDDLVPVVQGGANKKATAAMIRTGLVSESTVRTANTILSGPTTGAAAAATFRALVAADIPSLSYQPLDATLTALAALGAGPGFLQVTGADTFSIAALSGAQVNTALAYTAANAAALNASNLTTGTIPDARFPAVLPAVSGANLTNLPGGISGLTTGVIPYATSGSALADSPLVRVDANTLAQRNGTAPQELDLYATYTDASNHRELLIGTNLVAGGDAAILLNGVGTGQIDSNLRIGTLAGNGFVYLVTAGTARWGVVFGNWVPGADNVYDIGTPALRVKDIHTLSVKTSGRSYLAVPASAPTDGDIANGAFSAYLDEAGNLLKFRVRYSDSTLKTGSIALT